MNLVELDANELSCVIGGCDPDDLEHAMTIAEAEEASAAPPPFPAPDSAIKIDFRMEWDGTQWVTPKTPLPGMIFPGQIP
jgi:hypothetical protein